MGANRLTQESGGGVPVIGLVGSRVDVDRLADVARAEGVDVRTFTDERSLLVPQIEAHQTDVDGWLMASEVLLNQSIRHLGQLLRPAGAVRVSGDTFTHTLLEAAREGTDLRWASVDCLPRPEVVQSFKRIHIDPANVRVMSGQSDRRPQADEEIEFHRRQRRRYRGAVGVTMSSIVQMAVSDAMECLLVVPSVSDIRSALRDVLHGVELRTHHDAQIAMALVDFDGDPDVLAAEVNRIGATLARPWRGGAEYLVVTTRGSLSAATGGLVRLASLSELALHSEQVHVGIGLGQVAPQAEELARSALVRARNTGPVAAVLKLRSGVEVVLETKALGQGGGGLGASATDFAALSRQAGLSVATLERVRAALAEVDLSDFTVGEISDRIRTTPDRARKILRRLESVGIVRKVGKREVVAGGRPQVSYAAEMF